MTEIRAEIKARKRSHSAGYGELSQRRDRSEDPRLAMGGFFSTLLALVTESLQLIESFGIQIQFAAIFLRPAIRRIRDHSLSSQLSQASHETGFRRSEVPHRHRIRSEVVEFIPAGCVIVEDQLIVIEYEGTQRQLIRVGPPRECRAVGASSAIAVSGSRTGSRTS